MSSGGCIVVIIIIIIIIKNTLYIAQFPIKMSGLNAPRSGAVTPSVRRERTQTTSRIRAPVVAYAISHTTAAARCDYPEATKG